MSAGLGYFLTVHEQSLKFQFCQKPQMPIFFCQRLVLLVRIMRLYQNNSCKPESFGRCQDQDLCLYTHVCCRFSHVRLCATL